MKIINACISLLTAASLATAPFLLSAEENVPLQECTIETVEGCGYYGTQVATTISPNLVFGTVIFAAVIAILAIRNTDSHHHSHSHSH